MFAKIIVEHFPTRKFLGEFRRKTRVMPTMGLRGRKHGFFIESEDVLDDSLTQRIEEAMTIISEGRSNFVTLFPPGEAAFSPSSYIYIPREILRETVWTLVIFPEEGDAWADLEDVE